MVDDALLILVATPIGHLGDLSPRAAAALTEADFWVVEDSRVSGKLAAHLGIRKTMRVLNDHSTDRQVEAILDELKSGRRACLLTDGGCPVVSDPGGHLCDLAHQAGLIVDAVPGPSAVTDALMLSGFYGQRFCFLGFLSRKPGPIREELLPYADSPVTLILFESPHRLDTLLEVAHGILGPRRYAICREMTKTHQQVYRNFLPTCPLDSEMPKKGEVTLVIEGKRKAEVAL